MDTDDDDLDLGDGLDLGKHLCSDPAVQKALRGLADVAKCLGLKCVDRWTCKRFQRAPQLHQLWMVTPEPPGRDCGYYQEIDWMP